MNTFKKNIKIIKSNFSKLVISFIIMLSVNINTTHALFGVGDIVLDPANLAQNFITAPASLASKITSGLTAGFTSISSVANVSLQIKELGLDPLVTIAASKILGKLQNQMTDYINRGGIGGGPAFLTNPDQFFKEIAKDQEVLLKQKLLGAADSALYAQNKDIYKLLSVGLKDDTATFQKSVTSSIGATICSKLGAEVQKAITLNEDPVRIETLKVTYNASCKSGDKAAQYKNQQDCAKNFSCGGFDSILAITQNLGQNTDAGRYEIAKANLESETLKKTQIVKDELQTSGGFLNKKKCINFSVGKNAAGEPICLQYETESPGIAAANSLQKLIAGPTESCVSANEVSEIVKCVAQGFVSGLLKKGINSGIASLKNSITGQESKNESTVNTGGGVVASTNSAGDTVYKYISNPDVYGNQINTPPAPDEDQKLFGDAYKNYVTGSLKIINMDLEQNSSNRALVQKELNAYKNTFNSYDQVAACYRGKYEAQIDKSRPGAFTYPDIIPQSVKVRAAELDSSVKNLQNILNLSKEVDAEVNANLKLFSATNYLNVMEYYRDKIDNALKNPNSLKSIDWVIRDSNNINGSPSLFDQLNTEAKETLSKVTSFGSGDGIGSSDSSPLGVCNALDPNPQTGGYGQPGQPEGGA